MIGKVVYSMNVSLDGFVETVDHGLDWAQVDDDLHAWFNEQEGAAEAFLYGRRMYELIERPDRVEGRARPLTNQSL